MCWSVRVLRSHKSPLLPASLLCISLGGRLIVTAEDGFAHSAFLLLLPPFFFILLMLRQGDNGFFLPPAIICFGLKA